MQGNPRGLPLDGRNTVVVPCYSLSCFLFLPGWAVTPHGVPLYEGGEVFVIRCHTLYIFCSGIQNLHKRVRCEKFMVEPKKSKVPVTIRIDPEILEFLKQEAEKRGETVSNYIRSSAVMRLNGELVPAGKDATRTAYLRSRGIR